MGLGFNFLEFVDTEYPLSAVCLIFRCQPLERTVLMATRERKPLFANQARRKALTPSARMLLFSSASPLRKETVSMVFG